MMITEKLENLIELAYTEEPDAFEFQSEIEMNKEWEKENDELHQAMEKKDKQEFFRARNAEINSVFKYLSKCRFIRNLDLITGVDDKRYRYIRFWIPEYKLSWLNTLRLKKLKRRSYNSSDGYSVVIE